MGLLRLEQSLCGCSLEVGSKILGWFHLIIKAIVTFILIIGSFIVIYGMAQLPSNSHETEKAVLTGLLIVFIIIVVIAAFSALFDILLLIGIYKRRPSFMLPWLVVEVIFIIGLVTSLFKPTKGAVLEHIGGTIVGICINLYCVMIVSSHYQDLTSGSLTTYNC